MLKGRRVFTMTSFMALVILSSILILMTLAMYISSIFNLNDLYFRLGNTYGVIFWIWIATVGIWILCLSWSLDRLDRWFDKKLAAQIIKRRIRCKVVVRSTFTDHWYEKRDTRYVICVKIADGWYHEFHGIENYSNFAEGEEVAVIIEEYRDKKGKPFRRDVVRVEKI